MCPKVCVCVCVCVWWQKQPSATCLAWKMIQVSHTLAADLWPCRKKVSCLPLSHSLSHPLSPCQENNLQHLLGGGVQKPRKYCFCGTGVFHKWCHIFIARFLEPLIYFVLQLKQTCLLHTLIKNMTSFMEVLLVVFFSHNCLNIYKGERILFKMKG